ncbi:hypothetical protein Csp1_19330 [Corynebacterium provencense]|uniref:Uncharacterized protein n=1 Tax=Corynebacterium provencense TaxID=1737425 RepID=A0A2Z3YVX3_9CORY|nr:hypothetical protein [Corynebacterium provencense]AWT26704.1 hypothetical protein Csp1_19330 [Corynebacterium provencense]
MSATEPTTLTLTRPGRSQASTLRRVAAVTTRILRTDQSAMARLIAVDGDTTDILLSTPLGCVVAQRVYATPSHDGAVVGADPLPSLLTGAASGDKVPAELTLGYRMDLLWTGAPPPRTGWTVVDTIPGPDVRDVYDRLHDEAREHSGPAGLPPSLLDQPLLRLTSRTQTGIIEVPGSVVAALGSFGLIVRPREELTEHDRIRVSITGSWIRIDALFGTVYLPRRGGLARIPSPR